MDLAAELKRHARPLAGPAGKTVQTLTPADIAAASEQTGLSLRQVEIAALQNQLLPERYLRNLGTLGWEGQLCLRQSCAAVVGCGGLGGGVIEGLARSGIGRLVAIDGDRFVPHNMNRQVLSTMATLDRPKAEVACERVAMVNPAVECDAHVVVATLENLPALLQGVDVLVDAVDTPAVRLVLQAGARAAQVPLVHGAIAGLIGQVTTVLPGDDTLTLLYGERPPDHGAEFVLGTPAPTPALIAALQVVEVIKLLTGKGDILRGQMLYVDLETGMIERLTLLARES